MTKKKTGINVIIGNYFFIFLLIICTSQTVIAQADPCSKPKVEVKLINFIDKAYKQLNKQYRPQSKDAWQKQIKAKVMEALKNNSPGTQFIPDCGEDCDYQFTYSLFISGAGESKEVNGVEFSQYTAYWLESQLAANNPCGFPSQVLENERTQDDRDIYYTINRTISAYGDIGKRIQEHEKSHPAPPRGAEMDISQDRAYVSPLEKETKLKIKINVTNCKGEIVYEKHHGHRVTLPKKTKRGEIEATKGFPQKIEVQGNLLILRITQPAGASATYTLKKGVKPEIYPINIVTCSREKMVVKKTEIHISGLEIKLIPRKRVINPGEETKIDIKLSKVNTKGAKTPVPGKLIELRIKGLINGQVFPSEEIFTDKDGKAILTYLAGDEDEKVTFHARFQPKNFSEYVQGKTSVEIIRSAVTAKITITKTNTRDFNETKGQPGSYHSIEQSNYKENFKCEIFLTCEKEPRIDYKADRKSFKIKIQRYYYLVKSARIQSASYEGQYSGHGKNSDAVGLRHSWNNNRSTSGLDFKLKSRASDPSIEITFDPSTGLITRVHLPTYYLTGTINEKYNVSGVKRESRKEWRYDYKLVPYNRNETKTSDLEFYSSHPSFDDPESCWKATGNMNTKFLRGQCSQIRNHKYLTEEETYKWEVTIRKNE